ncbi:IclR family transcriptional regulator [Haloferax larsenii]|uniref:DNA-binding transcriptional regulator, IclR family n=1 Tax=Haloferax larsenii TaxID=302484 RepID=A0A1H7PKR9_HALLR|nr:IclR family transcriptional regulator [Haloferax larsenii]UVE52373.1 IclR family transcriptional regulator [Haloferax larsenii]SEL36014.1 DNA-binding transcriptional regulator, IclR family [Haloferax larsenii]
MTVDQQRRPVKTAATSFAILERLKEQGTLGPTALASELDLAKSTVHRHLKTLEQEGYVVLDEDGYRVGLRLLDFGIHARNQHNLYEVAKPKVDELAEQTGEKVWCVTEEQGRGYHLYGAGGKHSVRTPAREGTRSYLHQLAAGKAILSAFPDDRVDEIIDQHGLPAKTNATITDRDELFEQLATIRDRGFALNREEIVPKLHAVGVPITDQAGNPVGAISLSGPSNRLTDDRLEDELANLLLGAANEVEINLSFS